MRVARALHCALLATTGTVAIPATAQQLSGTTVTGALSSPNSNAVITQQFNSPAVVNAGTEFTGAINETTFGQNFSISANFSNNNLVIQFTSADTNANTSSTNNTAILNMSFGSPGGLFPNIAAVTKSCAPGYQFCPNNSNGILSRTTSNQNISIDFRNVYAGDIYTFSSAAPEPLAWVLMIFGFGVVGYAMRRRRVAFRHALARA